MPADSKVEHHLPPTASCLMDDGPSAVEQGTGLKGTCPQCASGEQKDGAPRGTATGARRMGASKRASTSAKVRAHRAGKQQADVGKGRW